MEDDVLNIGDPERLALEREYERLAKSLYERGVITPEAYARAVAPPAAVERLKEGVV